jgi:large subunit ribosomal protein L14e
MTIEVGRLCVKIAGRDAGKECLIIDVLDENFVMIDGNTRRRKCNIKHLEVLPKTAKLKTKAAHEDVAKALKDLGFEVKAKRVAKPKKKVAKKADASKQTLREKVAAKVKKTEKPKKEVKAKPKAVKKPATKPKTEKKAKK